MEETKASVRPAERGKCGLAPGYKSGALTPAESVHVKEGSKAVPSSLFPALRAVTYRNQSLSAPSTNKTKTQGSAPKPLAPRTTHRPHPSAPSLGDLTEVLRQARVFDVVRGSNEEESHFEDTGECSHHLKRGKTEPLIWNQITTEQVQGYMQIPAPWSACPGRRKAQEGRG